MSSAFIYRHILLVRQRVDLRSIDHAHVFGLNGTIASRRKDGRQSRHFRCDNCRLRSRQLTRSRPHLATVDTLHFISTPEFRSSLVALEPHLVRHLLAGLVDWHTLRFHLQVLVRLLQFAIFVCHAAGPLFEVTRLLLIELSLALDLGVSVAGQVNLIETNARFILASRAACAYLVDLALLALS